MATKNSSLLFMPALEDRFWSKLSVFAADLWGVVIDLEDSIHPNSKVTARDAVARHRETLEQLRQRAPHLEVILRVNNRSTTHYGADVELANALAEDELITTLMYPKTEGVDEVKGLAEACNERLTLFPTIETLAGYSRFSDILAPEHRVAYTAIGAEDICADMNVERPVVFYDSPLLNHITAAVALHATRLGISLWGNIWPYLSNTELLPAFHREIVLDQQFGAIGKIVFHPYQIRAVNGIFSSQHRNEEQKRLMLGRLHAIAKRSEERGLTVAVYNGRMVDMPEIVRLKRWYQSLSDEGMRAEVLELLPAILSGHVNADE